LQGNRMESICRHLGYVRKLRVPNEGVGVKDGPVSP